MGAAFDDFSTGSLAVAAMLGFVTTVVLCKYVLRRDIFE